jgi:hypothetical protein
VLGSVPFNKLVLKGQRQPESSWQQQWQEEFEEGEDGELELLDLGPAGVDDGTIMTGAGAGTAITAAAAAGAAYVPEVQPAIADDTGGIDGAEQQPAAAAAAAAITAPPDGVKIQQQPQPKQPRQFAFERHLQMLENTWKQPTA